ncbi:MAG: hypothetical protein O2968_13320 [Acidobacteria bacterium]|nr:hypothetical protein [Acidobacteriota bacterium]
MTDTFLKRWAEWADSAEQWIETRWLTFLILYSLVYGVVACLYGARKLYWFDEIITHHLVLLCYK